MHLAAIVLVALVPALAVGAAGIWLAIGSFQRASDDRLRDAARGVSLGLNREIALHISTLATLAASPSLDAGPSGDLGNFIAHARRAADFVNSTIGLVGPDLRVRSSANPSPLLPLTSGAEATRRAFESGLPSVSNLLTGSISGRLGIIVNVPALRGGQVVAVLITRIEPDRLSGLLAAPNLSGGTVATVADGRNVIVARSQDADKFIGQQAPEWFTRAIDGHQEGFATGRILTGAKVRLAFQRVSGTPGWTLTVLQPLSTHQGTWLPMTMTLALGGAAALVLALIFAMWLGRRVLSPIGVLQRQAEAVAAGGRSEALGRFPANAAHMGVAEFEALREAISSAGLAIAASHRRHRALVETGAAALWHAEGDGHILESRGWELLTGQSNDELRGHGWLQALHPDDVGGVVSTWQAAMAARRPVNAEYRVRVRDGQWLWHQARGVPILGEDGEIQEWFGVITNIHDRKSAEAALGASEARMRALVDTAPDAIVVIDADGRIQSFNQGAERIFGYAAGEIVGRNFALLMAKPGAGPEGGGLAHILPAAGGQPAGAVAALDGLRQDGSLVPLEASFSEWRDAEGHQVFTGVLRDITERRAAEERQTLLAREVDHRAKNALTVVQSVLRLTPPSDPKSFAGAIEARVSALARAHSLLAQEGWMAADFRSVAERELAAHARRQGRAETIVLAGPPFRLASSAVQPMAMVLHELATNAAKHGALTRQEGTVRLSWEVDAGARRLRLHWVERGGPPVARPSRQGFGSRVIGTTIGRQFGGHVEWHWEAEGLVCEVSVPLERVAAQPLSPRA